MIKTQQVRADYDYKHNNIIQLIDIIWINVQIEVPLLLGLQSKRRNQE